MVYGFVVNVMLRKAFQMVRLFYSLGSHFGAKSTLRLPGLSLDFARDGSRDGEFAEPKAWACSGLTLSGSSLPRLKRRGLAQPNGSKRK